MSAQIPGTVPAAKGAVCYALDIVSKGPRSRYRLARLKRALRRLPPNKRGLSECFDEHLLRYVFKKKSTRVKIVNHLNEFWFNPNSDRPYFPGVPVARVYAEGVVQAINVALGRVGRVVPLDCWWTMDGRRGEIQMLSLAERKSGRTVSPVVTLLIQTPRPRQIAGLKPEPPWILGDAEAYVTRLEGRRVSTQRVKTLS